MIGESNTPGGEMTALPLLDLLRSEADAARFAGTALAVAEERLAEVAERLVNACLMEYEQLDALDLSLGAKPGEPANRNTRILIRAMYEEWAARAAALLERVQQLHRSGRRVARYEELRHAEGRTAAMLSVSLADIEEAQAQLRRGEGISGEEVRRELQARIRAQG
jgi:hypothetical protein